MQRSRLVYHPKDTCVKTIEDLRKALPHSCFSSSHERGFDTRVYSRHSYDDRKIKVSARVAQDVGRSDDVLLHVEVTSEADPFISQAYEDRNVASPNPARFGELLRGSWSHFRCQGAEKLIVLVREIIEFKRAALELASKHVGERRVLREYHVNHTTRNPAYDDALDEYSWARHRTGWVAHTPEQDGIPEHITTSVRRTRIEVIAGTDTVGQISRMNKADLFEQPLTYSRW